jgi:plasmid segregation protein ParM
MQEAIGLDIGHSAVKVAAMTPFLFPTAAIPALDLAVDTASDSARSDTVQVGNQSYFVGETAVIHSGGRAIDGLSDNWIDTDEHHALLIAGYTKARRQRVTNDATLALGLPSRLYSAQKERLRTTAARLLTLPTDRVIVLPQPMAAFYTRLLDADGVPACKGEENGKWIIIDVGYYTTDFGCIDREIWSVAGQESMAGTYIAAQQLKRLIADRYGLDLTVRDAERALRTKRLLDQGETIDVTELVAQSAETAAKSIIDGAIRVFGSGTLRGANGIFVAGGGAALLFDAIKATWKHATCATNPRFAVAEGLRRCALAFGLVEA